MEIDVLTCQHHVEHETGCPSCARDAVFDAAMAWRRSRREHDLAPTQLTGVGLELAEGVLEDACDKAEEVERG